MERFARRPALIVFDAAGLLFGWSSMSSTSSSVWKASHDIPPAAREGDHSGPRQASRREVLASLGAH